MNDPVLVTLAGRRGELDLNSMSNFEAGIATLMVIDKVYPGARWSDLPAIAQGRIPERMAGWWTDLKHAVGDVKDGVGDVLKDTFSTVGGGAGDAVRLATSEKVIDGASRLGTAYATSGGSEGIRNLFGGGSGSPLDGLLEFVSGLGSSAKASNAQAASVGGGGMGIPPMAWILGGGVVLVLLMRR